MSGRCPVCEGAGQWDAKTGAVIWTKPAPVVVTTCLLCRGAGRLP